MFLPPITELVARPGPVMHAAAAVHNAIEASIGERNESKAAVCVQDREVEREHECEKTERRGLSIFPGFGKCRKRSSCSHEQTRSPSPSTRYPTSSARDESDEVEIDVGLSPILASGSLFAGIGGIGGIGAIPVLKRSNSKDKKNKIDKERPPSPGKSLHKDLENPPLMPSRPAGLMMGLSAPPLPAMRKPPSPLRRLEHSGSLKLPKLDTCEGKPRRRLSLTALINPPLRRKSLEIEQQASRPDSPADSLFTIRTDSTRPTTYAPSISDSIFTVNLNYASSTTTLPVDDCSTSTDCGGGRDSSPSDSSSSDMPNHPLTPAALSPKLQELMLGGPLSGSFRALDLPKEEKIGFPLPRRGEIHVTVQNASHSGGAWPDIYSAAHTYQTSPPTPTAREPPGVQPGLDFAQYNAGMAGSGGGGGSSSNGSGLPPMQMSRPIKREEEYQSYPPLPATRGMPPSQSSHHGGQFYPQASYASPADAYSQAFSSQYPIATTPQPINGGYSYSHQQQQVHAAPSYNVSINVNVPVFGHTFHPQLVQSPHPSPSPLAHPHPQPQRVFSGITLPPPPLLHPHAHSSSAPPPQMNGNVYPMQQMHHPQMQQQQAPVQYQHSPPHHLQPPQASHHLQTQREPPNPRDVVHLQHPGGGHSQHQHHQLQQQGQLQQLQHRQEQLQPGQYASHHQGQGQIPRQHPVHSPLNPPLAADSPISAFPAFHPASQAPHEHDQQGQPTPPPAVLQVDTKAPAPAPLPAPSPKKSRKRKAPSDEEDVEPSPSPSPSSSSDDEYDPRAERRQRAAAAPPRPRASAVEGTPTVAASKKGSLECEYCGKKFERMSVLKTHLNCHTGAKPYLCTVEGCDATFGVLSNMYRHVRSHTTPRSSTNTRRKRTKPAGSAAVSVSTSTSTSTLPSTADSGNSAGGGA